MLFEVQSLSPNDFPTIEILQREMLSLPNLQGKIRSGKGNLVSCQSGFKKRV